MIQSDSRLAMGWQGVRSTLLRVDRMAGQALPSVVRWCARDITDELNAARILVLSPHPDDETLACGATISRVIQSGGTAIVVVATDGGLGIPSIPPRTVATTRREEVIAAMETLGVGSRDLILLELPDSALPHNEEHLKKLIEDILEDRQPDTVFSPLLLDTHPDHAALGRAARAVLHDGAIRHLEYLIWGWGQPCRLLARSLSEPDKGHRLPGRPVRIGTHGCESAKAQALACHKSQFAADATLFGIPLNGTGPLDTGFLRPFEHSSEVFFPGPSRAMT